MGGELKGRNCFVTALFTMTLEFEEWKEEYIEVPHLSEVGLGLETKPEWGGGI